jgi:hypothetical protein
MADATVVHIGENSPEEVAYKLLRVKLGKDDRHVSQLTLKEMLDIYAECLNAVKGELIKATFVKLQRHK